MKAAPTTPTAPALTSPATPRRRRTGYGPALWVPVGIAVAIVLMAVFAPLLAPYPPGASNVLHALQGPSPAHWLGTDAKGRDILSRLIFGSQTALLGPLIVVVVSTGLGVLLGVLAAWHGGVTDSLIGRFVDLVFAFPAMILALVMVAVLSPGLAAAALATSIVFIAPIARLVRASGLREVNAPYVEAMRLGGISGRRIVARHVVPNLSPVIIAQATTAFGFAMVELAGISYLGFGVQEPTPDWGLMIQQGQSSIVRGHPGEALYAGILLVITVVAFIMIGDVLSERRPRKSA